MLFMVKSTPYSYGNGEQSITIQPGEVIDLPEDLGRKNSNLQEVELADEPAQESPEPKKKKKGQGGR